MYDSFGLNISKCTPNFLSSRIRYFVFIRFSQCAIDKVRCQIRSLSQCLISQMCVSLRHARVLVREQLLKGIHVYLPTGGQHGSICMPESVERPELFWETCFVCNSPCAFVKILSPFNVWRKYLYCWKVT